MDNEFVKVPEKDKTLSPGKLFYNWFAANIGIMGFVYGAIIVSYHLSFWQSVTAALIGALTFAIPGWVAMIGQREGVTTFTIFCNAKNNPCPTNWLYKVYLFSCFRRISLSVRYL